LFHAGDEVGIQDEDSVGWNIAHALVHGVRGNDILLDRRLPRTYNPDKGGSVVHGFMALTAQNASRIVIRDLVIDGRTEETNPGQFTDTYLGFNFAAIHLVQVTDSRIEGCQVLGWPNSDGIVLSRGGGIKVVNCLVQDCRGHGYHPGGGVRDTVFTNNVAQGNGRDGLFFCARVQHVVVSNSVFTGNRGNGIGGLGDDGDKYNIVTGNVCQANGASGISLFDGADNTVTNNICVNNSQSSPGRYSGILLNKTSDTLVTGNRCLDDQETKTQKHGIFEFSSCHGNLFANNLCRGNGQSGLALAGRDGVQTGNLE
jgi:parallel beta-helix repeat protein